MAKSRAAEGIPSSHTDGTFNELATPLNVPKAKEDPQADLNNSMFPGAKGESLDDPMGYLDLTGPRGRRGDPK